MKRTTNAGPRSRTPATAAAPVVPPGTDHARLAFTVAEAVRVSGIGRTTIYVLLASGRLEARKVGRRTLIPAEALRELLANLPRADRASGARH